MPTFYVEVALWVDAEDEDEARRDVEQAMTMSAVTSSYDILSVAADDA